MRHKSGTKVTHVFLQIGAMIMPLVVGNGSFSPPFHTHLSHVYRSESARLLEYWNDSTRDRKHFCKYPSEMYCIFREYFDDLYTKTLEIAKMRCLKITVTSRHVLSSLLSVINMAVSQATNFQVPRNNFFNQNNTVNVFKGRVLF